MLRIVLSVTDSAKIRDLIYKYFQIAKDKDIERISDFLIPDGRFSKFGDSLPYERRDFERALMLEQLQFAGISDYDFTIEDFKTEFFSDTAVSTFLLKSTGIVVDDYSFRGATISNTSRATIVLHKDKRGEWLMVHQHLSKVSDQ